jgi:hypothetical protein
MWVLVPTCTVTALIGTLQDFSRNVPFAAKQFSHLGLITSDVESSCYLVFEDRNPVKRKPKPSRIWTKTKRLLTYLVLLLVVLGLAARPLARGALFYQSYWGGAIFVPLVLFVGAVILVIAVVDWKRK